MWPFVDRWTFVDIFIFNYYYLIPFELIALALARMRSSSAAFARAIATEFVEATEPNEETDPDGERPRKISIFSEIPTPINFKSFTYKMLLTSYRPIRDRTGF